jgi:chromate reductase
MTHRPRLLGISGSLRHGSHNTAILETLREILAPRADLVLFPLDEIPLYSEDRDTATPPAAVAALRQAIGEADGLIISTPEYNYGVPGLLKNALDWASRPYGTATVIGKPALVITASPAFTGGVRAQGQLTETLLAIGARPLQRPQTVIAAVHEKVRDGRLVDEATLAFALSGAEDLLAHSTAAALRQAA